MSVKNSVNELIEKGKVLPDLVVASDNFNFKQFRMSYKNQDGTSFTQDQCARSLDLYDANVVSKYERNELRIDSRTYTVFLLLTSNHPLYDLKLIREPSKNTKLVIEPPSPEEIKKVRESVGLAQNQTSKLLGLHEKQFGKYESTSAKTKNRRTPSAHTWTLFLLMVNKHPFYKLIKLKK